MNETAIEKLLKEDGYLVYKTKGISMQPMLVENKSIITLRAKKDNERFNENDVVLYKRRKDNAFVLHRIVKVNDDDYVLLGDNCVYYEHGIKDEDILAILTEYRKGSRTIKTTDEEYLKYVRKLRKNELLRIKKRKIRIKVVQKIKSFIKSFC